MLNREPLTAPVAGPLPRCTLPETAPGIADPGPVFAPGELLAGDQPWARHCLREAAGEAAAPAADTLDRALARWLERMRRHTGEQRMVRDALCCLHAFDRALEIANPACASHRWLGSGDCRRWLMRQLDEERRRPERCRRLIEVFGPLPETIEPASAMARWLLDRTAGLETEDGRLAAGELFSGLLAAHLAFKGLLLRPALIQLLALARRADLPAVDRLFALRLREEERHLRFGTGLAEALRRQHPYAWDTWLEARVQALLGEALLLAVEYAYASLPHGILGLNAPMLEEYLLHQANRCARAAGLPAPWPDAGNPFDWLDPSADD